jgi:hypothetical protein
MSGKLPASSKEVAKKWASIGRKVDYRAWFTRKGRNLKQVIDIVGYIIVDLGT